MKVKVLARSSANEIPARFDGWLTEKFGDNFAQISTFVCLKLRSSIRDVARMRRRKCSSCDRVYVGDRIPDSNSCGCGGKIFSFVPQDIEALSKRIKKPPQGVEDKEFVFGYQTDEGYVPGSIVEGHENSDSALIEYVEHYPEDWEIVQKCLGLARQQSRHACAYIISDQSISNFIPTTTIGGFKCTQYTAEDVEGVGGLKMDFLVITALKDIQDCIQAIKKNRGIDVPKTSIGGRLVPPHRIIPKTSDSKEMVDIWDLPEDQEVFKDIASGQTETVFQFKTESAIGWLSYFDIDKPDGTKAIASIEDMAAFTALDRPGPLDIFVSNPETGAQHNMLVEYSRRSAGLPGSPDVLSVLDEFVPETYGILTYQEQLERIYQEVTGCPSAEAEKFRIFVSKKMVSKIDECYGPFIERASKRLGEEQAKALWEFIKTWGKYGFNKSHAVCYAVIAYACAYLKHHYPLEWWSSLLGNSSKDDINKKYWRYCSNFVELPDIQLSSDKWEVSGQKIRAPLSLLNGVGETAHLQLCEYAPYSSIKDFTDKIIFHAIKHKATTTVADKKTGMPVKKTVWGRSSITRGIVKKLIVGGAMDSLFDPNSTIGERIDIFEKSYKESHLLTCECKIKHVQARCVGKKFNRDNSPLRELDSLERFQMTKSILPAYSEDIRLLISGEIPKCLSLDGERLAYPVMMYSKESRQEKLKNLPILSPTAIEKLLNLKGLPDGEINFAGLAYIEDVRIFRYGPSKEKEAMDLTLDLCGVSYNVVHWPGRDSDVLPSRLKDSMAKGGIVAVHLNKWNPDKGYSIKSIDLVKPPRDLTGKGDEE